MPEPFEPDPPRPLPPARGGAAQHRRERSGLLALSVLLLVIGVGLAYTAFTRRWGYYSGVPLSASDWSTLTPAEHAAMTVWWGDTMIGCWCGPFPVIWPAVALLSTLPLLVAAIRQHAVPRWWSRFGLLSALCGCANVFVIAYGIGLAGQLNDGGWKWSVDSGTLAIALSGYVLLILGILVLTRATSSALSSTRPTLAAGG